MIPATVLDTALSDGRSSVSLLHVVFETLFGDGCSEISLPLSGGVDIAMAVVFGSGDGDDIGEGVD